MRYLILILALTNLCACSTFSSYKFAEAFHRDDPATADMNRRLADRDRQIEVAEQAKRREGADFWSRPQVDYLQVQVIGY